MAKKINPTRLALDERACSAAETLAAFLQHSTRQSITSPWRRRQPLYGIFNGDILITWGFGHTAAKWAERTAANCWGNELSPQYLGSFCP